jgi:hypothetical protein
VRLVKTPAGHLLRWERGTTRYWLGYRITRSVKRWHVSRWQIAIRPFAAHFVAFPMTEAEKKKRSMGEAKP